MDPEEEDLERALDALRAVGSPGQGELSFRESDSESEWGTLPPASPEDVDLAPGAVQSIAALDEGDERFETVDDPRIPEKQSYFKIGEVAKIIGVKPYVLRYWEGEFPWVRPEKTSSRQRRYRRQDVAMLLTIRRMRHDEQLTVARARELIQEMKKTGKKRSTLPKGAKRPLPIRAVEEPVLEGVDPALLRRRLGEMRQALLELLSAVEE